MPPGSCHLQRKGLCCVWGSLNSAPQRISGRLLLRGPTWSVYLSRRLFIGSWKCQLSTVQGSRGTCGPRKVHMSTDSSTATTDSCRRKYMCLSSWLWLEWLKVLQLRATGLRLLQPRKQELSMRNRSFLFWAKCRMCAPGLSAKVYELVSRRRVPLDLHRMQRSWFYVGGSSLYMYKGKLHPGKWYMYMRRWIRTSEKWMRRNYTNIRSSASSTYNYRAYPGQLCWW